MNTLVKLEWYNRRTKFAGSMVFPVEQIRAVKKLAGIYSHVFKYKTNITYVSSHDETKNVFSFRD